MITGDKKEPPSLVSFSVLGEPALAPLLFKSANERLATQSIGHADGR